MSYKIEWNDKEIITEITSKTEKLTEKAAKIVEAEAKRLCPVGDWEKGIAKTGKYAGRSWTARRPGKLRDAITAAKSKFKDGGWIVYVPAQGSDTYYVRWVELGAPARSHEQWRSAGHKYPVPRQPFLRPALKKSKVKIKRLFNAE
jgi:HK97 gp10 family phage protein